MKDNVLSVILNKKAIENMALMFLVINVIGNREEREENKRVRFLVTRAHVKQNFIYLMSNDKIRCDMIRENTITNITEIPKVLEEENVKQPIIHLITTIEGKERNVVLMGETHIATEGEARGSDRILPYFKYIGCEGVDISGCIEGRLFFWIMNNIIAPFIGIFLFGEKRSKKNKSSLDKAAEYYDSGLKTNEKNKNSLFLYDQKESDRAKCEDSDLNTKEVLFLEKGWKPSIRMRIFFIAFPALIIYTVFSLISNSVGVANEYGIWWSLVYFSSVMLFIIFYDKIPVLKDISRLVTRFILDYVFDLGPSRNRNMAKNLVVALSENEKMDDILVLTGSNHTYPMAKILKNKYGFIEKDF